MKTLEEVKEERAKLIDKLELSTMPNELLFDTYDVAQLETLNWVLAEDR